jgi:hypothetical protein
MTDKEKSLYFGAMEFLMVAGSDVGEDIRKTRQDDIRVAQQIVDRYEVDYLTEKSMADAQISDLITAIDEAKSTIPLLNVQSDLPQIDELNKLIKNTTQEIQGKILYEPKLFYKKYFFGLESHQNDMLVANAKENERFNLWFANSKVVNDNGNPMVVYHGTSGLRYEFDEFKFSPFPAVYFAENKSYSEWFAQAKGGNGIMFNCFLRCVNPLDLSIFQLDEITYEDLCTYINLTFGYDLPQSTMLTAMSKQNNGKGLKVWQWLRFGVDIINALKKTKEFDSITYYENNPQQIVDGKENITKAWLVFDGNQIKSADIRNITYSLETNKITMEKGGIL